MFILNPGQEAVVNAAIDFYKNSSEQVFQFTGPPGTGKSVVLSEILKRLHLPLTEVAPMAFTGSAAIVMRLKGLVNAKTIHSWLYEPVPVPMIDNNGGIMMDNYLNRPIMTLQFLPKDLSGIKLIIFDEGWTVPMHMKQHILDTGCKIIAAGDPDQLPPVADEPAFFTSGKVHHLTQIMRQAEGSPIVYLSHRAIKGLPIHTGNYGNVMVITEDELTDEMLNMTPVVLCGKNVTRDKFNKRIREDIKGFRGDLPKYGEKLICRKNNWAIERAGISLTNGLTGTVVNQPDVGGFDGKTFGIDFIPDVANDIVFPQIRVDYKYLKADKEKRDSIKKSHYYSENLFEYGYTQTVHLAQGSQWPAGIYLEEYIRPEINNHLNYTALTRFANMAIYVKQKRKYGVNYDYGAIYQY